MKKNLGAQGRILRLAMALALLICAIVFKSWILLAFALFTFYEALASWCILYQILGINSCPIDKH